MTEPISLKRRLRQLFMDAIAEMEEILEDPNKPKKRRPMRGRVLYQAWAGAIGISVWWDKGSPHGVKQTAPAGREERLQWMIDSLDKPRGRDTRRQHCKIYLDKFIERGMFKVVMVDGVEMIDYVPGSEKVLNVDQEDPK